MTSHERGAQRALWYSHCGHSPLAIAIQNGWIAEDLAGEDIALKSVKRDGSPDEQLSHYDHHIPWSVRQGGSAPALWARSIGTDTRLIGINWLDEFQAVIALPGSGIITGRDLAGRRLGLLSANHPIDHTKAAHLRGYLTALDLAGLSLRDVELVELPETLASFGSPGAEEGQPTYRPGGRGVDALRNGLIDALFVRGPHGVAVVDALKAVVVTAISDHPDPLVRVNNGTPRPLTVHARLLRDRPDVVARLVRRVASVGAWAPRNADEAARLIGKQSGVGVSTVARAYAGQLADRLTTTLDDVAVAGLEAYKRFLFEHRFLPFDFSITEWIESRPLHSAQARQPVHA